MREPPVKKILYWCGKCNVPLLGKTCGCGSEGHAIPLLQPYDIRPALQSDHRLIARLLEERHGIRKLPSVLLLNKTGGIDRKDLVIANGGRFGWLSFDPVHRSYEFELSFEALPSMLPFITKNILELGYLRGAEEDVLQRRGIGGKKYPATRKIPDGGVVLRWNGHAGVGVSVGAGVKVKEVGKVSPVILPDPGWEDVISRNRQHLKNLERNAVRFIRQQTEKAHCVNISFSGGKDSTAVRELARRAGFEDTYYVDTGMEFPETLEFVRAHPVKTILHGGDFWREVNWHGPPTKDDRWCCEHLKLSPVKKWLSGKGECMTIQGNRWCESFARAGLAPASKNPYNPSQTNISPIRNWRALEVFLYIWWRNLPSNPLYERGLERVGCWMCPAMLESEFEYVQRAHPELYQEWIAFLKEWIRKRGGDQDSVTSGAWRWKTLPPKMRGKK